MSHHVGSQYRLQFGLYYFPSYHGDACTNLWYFLHRHYHCWLRFGVNCRWWPYRQDAGHQGKESDPSHRCAFSSCRSPHIWICWWDPQHRCYDVGLFRCSIIQQNSLRVRKRMHSIRDKRNHCLQLPWQHGDIVRNSKFIHLNRYEFRWDIWYFPIGSAAQLRLGIQHQQSYAFRSVLCNSLRVPIWRSNGSSRRFRTCWCDQHECLA